MHREFLLPHTHTINNPVESHVHRFGHLGGNGVVGETHCTFVVTEDWSRRLGVPHVVQDVALGEKRDEPLRRRRCTLPASPTKEQTTGIRVEWAEMGCWIKWGWL
jgi:hypothetical protein